MNISFYIARRHLFSKKTHNVINIISFISMVGVATCTAAMVIVLSAFNGIEDLVGTLYNAFDSDIRITLKEGKTFDATAISEGELRAIEGVAHYTRVIEESVGLEYRDRQTIAVLKGVEADFAKMTGIDSMMYEGEFILNYDADDFMVLGRGLQNELGMQISYNVENVSVYAIQRGHQILQRGKSVRKSMEEAIKSQFITVAGVFSINAELDTKYAIVPLHFAKSILDYGNDITAIEVGLTEGADPERVQRAISALVGDAFDVKTRYMQNEIIFKTTRTEKWITFLMLAFILLIAAFNVIANLSMLVIDKKKDVSILSSIGLNNSMVRNIFFMEGMLICAMGCFYGLILGLVFTWLQQTFGLIPLEGSVVPYYPVKMIWTDFVAVAGIVLMIGLLVTWIPVQYFTRKHFAG